MRKIGIVILVFVVGFIIGSFFDFGLTGRSVFVPSNHFDSEDILVFPDRIEIKVEDAKITNYASTGSMLPVFGADANGIVVKPLSESEINVGDIVSFRRGENLIVHRVIEKGIDSEGIYFVTKGDNSLERDGKIRFGEIEHVLVGLVY